MLEGDISIKNLITDFSIITKMKAFTPATIVGLNNQFIKQITSNHMITIIVSFQDILF